PGLIRPGQAIPTAGSDECLSSNKGFEYQVTVPFDLSSAPARFLGLVGLRRKHKWKMKKEGFQDLAGTNVSTIHLRSHRIANLYRRSIQGFSRTAAPLTSMLASLTSSGSQPGRVVDEVDDEVAGETGNSDRSEISKVQNLPDARKNSASEAP
ncbi:hypothetical protein MMC31_005346, partial [Peltigera leucophlebia]|nr:hypothetical protein [Peltigera leucophlebia]